MDEGAGKNKRINRKTIAYAIFLLVIFLLPWQTRWIFRELTLGQGVWEYGRLSIYAVEVLIFLSAIIKGKHQPMGGARKPIGYGILFLGGVFISISFAINGGLAFGQMLHLAAAFAFFYLLLERTYKTKHFVIAFILGLIVPAVLGWVQVLTGMSPASSFLGLAVHEAAELGQSVVETESGRILRAYGSLSHPNVFGGFLAVGTLLLGWLVHVYQDHKYRLLLAVPIVISSATLVITFSRSAWLATIVGFLVLLALMMWFKRTLPRDAIPLGTVGLLAVLATLIMFQSAVFTRFQPNLRLEAQSIEQRAGEYSHVIDVVRQNPFTGVGLGGYTQALWNLDPGAESWAYQPIHNTIILIFAETGLLGLFLFVLWFASIDKINYRVKRTVDGMFGMSLGTVILVIALFDHYAWTSWPGLALMAFSFAMMLRWSLEAKR